MAVVLLPQPSFTQRARQALLPLIAQGEQRRERVAATLCISERTLQRGLAEEGTRFNELVDAIRCELAQRLLSDGGRSAAEMSSALGFSDPSNFHRACKRWFGGTPESLRNAA